MAMSGLVVEKSRDAMGKERRAARAEVWTTPESAPRGATGARQGPLNEEKMCDMSSGARKAQADGDLDHSQKKAGIRRKGRRARRGDVEAPVEWEEDAPPDAGEVDGGARECSLG